MLYILPLEPLPERYTIQWRRWFAQALAARKIDHVFIDGASLTSSVESGSVLDAEGTNFYKFSQLQAVCRLFKDGMVKDGDKFFTFDLWMPGLESIPYMAHLENKKIELYGFLHAGSYIDGDFAQPMSEWANHFETGWFRMCKKVFVGTNYHKQEFTTKRITLKFGFSRASGFFRAPTPELEKLVVTGNPFNVAEIRSSDWVPPYKRKNVIVFPHRWDTEKRPDLFMFIMAQLWKRRQDFEVLVTTSRPMFRSNSPDLMALIVQAPFPVRIASGISKETYYQLLSTAKVFVSTAIEETFGYCLVESVLLGCTPVVPDGLSYPEILRGDKRYLMHTPAQYVDAIDHFLDSPCPCVEYVQRYNNSVGNILTEMGYKL